MTSTPLQTRSPRTSAWLAQHWHYLVLAGAAIILAGFYFPAYCRGSLDGDMIIPAIFSWDLWHGGKATDWYWGGASFLFPDLSAHFILRAILGDGVRALQAASALLFVGWVTAVVLIYRSCELPNIVVFTTMMLLLVLGMAEVSIPAFFHSVEHGGTHLVTLLAVGWLLRAWQRDCLSAWSILPWCAAILLTAASDTLVVVGLVMPAVAALALGAARFPGHRARAFGLAVAITLAAGVGMAMAQAIFPPHLFTGYYLAFNAQRVADAFRELRQILDLKYSGAIGVLAYADMVFLPVIAVMLWRQWKSAAGPGAQARFLVIAFTFFLLPINWAAALLSGNLTGVWDARYVIVSMIAPVLFAAALLSAKLPWPPWRVQVLAVVTAVCSVAGALHPPVNADYLYESQVIVPALSGLMKRENMPVALSDYWSANIATVLSSGAARVLPLSRYGLARFWFSNKTWYENPQGGFRLILTQDGGPEMYRALFGDPGRIEKIGNDEAWIYAPEDAIHYIPSFNTIGNSHCFPDANTYRASGAGLCSWIGQMENGRIVARPGRDLNGLVADGPEFTIGPGRYRVEYTYEFLEPPQAGRGPIFKTYVELSGRPKALGYDELRYAGPGVQKAVHEFTLAPGETGWLLSHIEFRGSGVIQVDQQEVKRLGD